MDQETIEVIAEISANAAKRVHGCSETQINRAGKGSDDYQADALARGIQAWGRVPDEVRGDDRVRWVARAVQNEISSQFRVLRRIPEEVMPYTLEDHGRVDLGFVDRLEAREVLGRVQEVATARELEMLLRVAAEGSAQRGFYRPGEAAGSRRWAAKQVREVRERIQERLRKIGVPLF